MYGLKNCGTCRKAIKSLPAPIFKDVREDGMSREVLEAACSAVGEELLNARSSTWRNLSAEEWKGDALELILKHPALYEASAYREGRSVFAWMEQGSGAGLF
ncbi:MAG: arsenate reductase [Roseovarius sp.]|nr:arsenate reductase [Roseovarius sp.]